METLPEEICDNKREGIDWGRANPEFDEARHWLERAVEIVAGPNAGFAARERTLLLASNEVCRRTAAVGEGSICVQLIYRAPQEL